MEGEKGLKRALFENLLEELAMDHDVMKFLQGSHESAK
jgi:alkaline phosphatase D